MPYFAQINASVAMSVIYFLLRRTVLFSFTKELNDLLIRRVAFRKTFWRAQWSSCFVAKRFTPSVTIRLSASIFPIKRGPMERCISIDRQHCYSDRPHNISGIRLNLDALTLRGHVQNSTAMEGILYARLTLCAKSDIPRSSSSRLNVCYVFFRSGSLSFPVTSSVSLEIWSSCCTVSSISQCCPQLPTGSLARIS